MKIWDKGSSLNEAIEKFTVGRDRELDMVLAEYDTLGTIAHVMMLEKTGLVDSLESGALVRELRTICRQVRQGEFVIEDSVEDVHSQVEMMLTLKLGDAGKKIHSGRSRNDQVLLDLKLFYRDGIQEIVRAVGDLFAVLIRQSNRYREVLMPGYTHLQAAMPSSFGLWFGAYAESLSDDLLLLHAAYQVINQNPLGSAAGYGSSFPVDRQMTTELLGFEDLHYNVVYAQMGRGKSERVISCALSSLAATLSKLAWDVCLYMNQNFGFLSLPDEFTTGSSIMPHKKNPDVFELVRSRCNRIQSHVTETTLITNNLPSGYFRDMQVLKETILPVFDDMVNCLDITTLAAEQLIINQNILEDAKYKHIFSVEEVNKKVRSGTPFRDAYRQVGEQIASGTFDPGKDINHTHEGSLGNLCNEEIERKFKGVLDRFPFAAVEEKMNRLRDEGSQ